ncbi:molybdopterin-guanine dinucleotide biosynthesis protein MobB [Paenibacillus thermotolerans]|uniref:molybdopterin-guanine dinucleotide biosynthesis protein MobB n=1 Tax=Paenibacillus thermotolerans TaxID=3027807 RepID=UPI0023676178|nr:MULTISPECIES: molybdopterin-guanine dinucleotide biosynthesis protein MobB [unclassified Paenibacillus]
MSVGIPVIGFVGDEESGKTTLAAQITKLFNSRGKKVKVLRSGVRDEKKRLRLEEEFAAAGAADFEISANYAGAMVRSGAYDVVVTDGFDGVPHPKVFVFRTEEQAGYAAEVVQPIKAAVTTQAFEKEHNAGIPIFYFHELDELFEFVLKELNIP